jgi:hypothetical protein
MKKPSASHPIVIAAPAQAFFHLELTPNEKEYKLSFSVKDETNIRYYVIEGSDDLISFEWLSRIYPKGTGGRPFTYNATIRNTSYDYYRIRQIDNMGPLAADDDIEFINIKDDGHPEAMDRKSKMHLAFANTYTY